MFSGELDVVSGILQGFALSSTLLNIGLSAMMKASPASTESCFFTDDITIWSNKDKDHFQASQNVQEALNIIDPK